MLVTVPETVATLMRPDPVAEETVVSMLVAVAAPTEARLVLTLTRLLVATVSKFVPVTVIAVPGVPMFGVKLVIVGGEESPTTKELLLAAEPAGVVTEIGPVVAPDGTVVTICVNEEEVTVAAVPLKETVF